MLVVLHGFVSNQNKKFDWTIDIDENGGIYFLYYRDEAAPPLTLRFESFDDLFFLGKLKTARTALLKLVDEMDALTKE